MIGHPVEMVNIPDKENITATYMAGLMKTAPHPKTARDFMNFLVSPTAKAVYKKYGLQLIKKITMKKIRNVPP